MSIYNDSTSLLNEFLDEIGDIDINELLKEHPPTHYPECLYGEMNPFYGKKHTEETKQYLSKINTKENHPQYGSQRSEETKEKIRSARIGKNHSDESRKKMSEAAKKRGSNYTGKKHSDETKRKMSINRKGFMSDRIWVNNGIENKRISSNIVPEGYELGRLPYTHKTMTVCPHCGFKGKKSGSMSRWHFDNCRNKL